MRKRVKKGFVMLFLAVMVLQILGVKQVAFAAEQEVYTENGIADFAQGEARIVISGNDGQSLKGKTFQVHKLFEAKNAAGLESIDYIMNSTYENALKTVVGSRMNKPVEEITTYMVLDYMQSINSYVVEGAQTPQELESRYSDYRYFMEELAEQIKKEELEGNVVRVDNTRNDNSVELKGLVYGYYMVIDASKTAGEHTAASMSMLTTANPNSTVRIKSDYPVITKKIQEDDNQELIENQGWNDIGDYEIGQHIPFQCETTIPNLNGYHTYYFAIHDNMDEALTLREDTIQIVIQGETEKTSKTYQLTDEEYRLTKNTSDTTFKIEIEDIKAILDREFPNQNEKEENTYGQKVTISYKAVLNDKAALDTGRPGFENDMRLEFSNNPNASGKTETGFTPWDTVVCFTYQLNGVKINNYGMNLEGAVFRLYADETCENEILVKRVADRYHVMNRDEVGDAVPENAVAIVSDENGEFDICGLDGGIYYLKEVEAPAGYRQILDPIQIQVNPVYTAERNTYVKGDGAGEDTVMLGATAHIKTYTNGAYREKEVTLEVDQEKGSMNLSIVNEVGNKLPVTGSALMGIFFVTGASMIALGLKKGKRAHE